MYTWIKDNLHTRLKSTNTDFNLEFTPYKFKPSRFETCSEAACIDIANKYDNLYIALSGGLDSEYVLRAFNSCSVSIVPVIVLCDNNTKEASYAFKVCDELKIQPVVIKVSETDLISSFSSYIKNTINGVGYGASYVMIAAEYVKRIGGTLVTGDHLLGDGDDIISDNAYAFSNEWDFYINSVFPEVNNINYFLYTPELVYSMAPSEYIGWNKYKSILYGIEYRDKIRPEYTAETLSYLKSLNRHHVGNRVRLVYTKTEFLNIFDKYIV